MKQNDWYEDINDTGYDASEGDREQAIGFVKNVWATVHNNFDSPTFHAAIWEASTLMLPALEVQVVIDGNNIAHVSTGSPGYVDFQINPVGMKLPIKCWIHTHPFGSAYFSGTDIRTVSIWGPKMHQAYVLGGLEHYGIWTQDRPKELSIFANGEHTRNQTWGDKE